MSLLTRLRFASSRQASAPTGLGVQGAKSFGEFSPAQTTGERERGSGEQFDADLGVYYLRARVSNPGTGRFLNSDGKEGDEERPTSLHRYTLCENDPVNNVDPSGNFAEGIGGLMMSFSISTILAQMPSVTSVGKASAKADTLVSLETHPVKLGHNHSYIVMTVNSGSEFFGDSRFGNATGNGGLHYATLGAGPKGIMIDILVSDVNRPTDVDRSRRNYWTAIRSPAGKTGDEFIQMLFDADAKYPDNLAYDIIPVRWLKTPTIPTLTFAAFCARFSALRLRSLLVPLAGTGPFRRTTSNNSMTKHLKAFALIAAVVAIVVLAAMTVVISNPLRRADADVRAWLLEQTPLGSSPQEVRTYAKKQGWFDPNRQGSDGSITGYYIRGELGRYRSIRFYTYVTVFWEFDSTNKLTDVRIWKTTDGL